MHVYFDVRGPGVLVDLYDLNKNGAVTITLGEAGLVSFPVMNTGEATDTFNFTATGPPAGWHPPPTLRRWVPVSARPRTSR